MRDERGGNRRKERRGEERGEEGGEGVKGGREGRKRKGKGMGGNEGRKFRIDCYIMSPLRREKPLQYHDIILINFIRNKNGSTIHR